MTISANAWCSVHYTTQDFTEISEIDQLHKGLGSKICPFVLGLLLIFTFASYVPVYIGFDVRYGGLVQKMDIPECLTKQQN